MPNYLKKCTIFAFVILFITGVVATAIEYNFIEVSPELRKNIIRLHVSWTVFSTVVFGMVLEGHVKKWWKKFNNSQKIFGLIVLIFFVLLIVTSIILRHFKTPQVQEITKLLHTIFGFVFFGFFVLHKFWKKVD